MTSTREKQRAALAKSGWKFRLKVTRMDLIKLAVLYIAFSPMVAMPLYNKILFFPFKDQYDLGKALKKIESATDSKKIDLTIPSGTNEKLQAWYFKKNNAQKVFLVSHGNGGNISHRIFLALTLLTCGNSVLLYDYQGYGQSTGEPSIAAVKQDGLAAYDYARNQLHYPAKDIILYGESLGCGVTTYIAENRPAGGIIIQSGFASLSSAARDRLPWMWLYPSFAFNNVELDNIAYVRGAHVPLLLIHGEQDAILPVKNADAMFAAASEPKQFLRIKTAGHNDACTAEAKLFANTVTHFVAALP